MNGALVKLEKSNFIFFPFKNSSKAHNYVNRCRNIILREPISSHKKYFQQSSHTSICKKYVNILCLNHSKGVRSIAFLSRSETRP